MNKILTNANNGMTRTNYARQYKIVKGFEYAYDVRNELMIEIIFHAFYNKI